MSETMTRLRKMILASLAALAVTLPLALQAGATTAYHEGWAEVIEPSDPERNPLTEVLSGIWFRQPEIRAMQDDDFENPGIEYVDTGAELWETADGNAGKSLAEVWDECVGLSLEEAATSYPRYNESAGKVVNIEQQINHCRETFMGAAPYEWESRELLAMTAYIRHQGRGKPVDVDVTGPNREVFERGEMLYNRRIGQFNIACAQCHTYTYGSFLRADMLSQGHSNGFPLYRLKWNDLGSVQRRIRGCFTNLRAESLPYGHDDMVALELYMAWRGEGLLVETPGVRQ